MPSFDLLVIGTGAAALSVAPVCREAGWSVAIVDARPYGGTCALRGCDPKKVLVGAAEAVDTARRLADHGVHAPQARIAWRDLMQFKRTFTEPVPEARARSMREQGITTLSGNARFVGPTTVDVDGTRVEARRIVIAAGASPAKLGIPGEEHVITSDVFLDLDELPARVAFIGGGFISFEFAHVAAQAGAHATILHRSDRPLKEFDPDLVSSLVAATREAGIAVRLGSEVQRVEASPGAFRVVTENGAVEADLVVHGAGRAPNFAALDPAAGGVALERGAVKVDEHLRSVTNPAVYAAGDCAATAAPALTPVASLEGGIVAHNLLNEAPRSPDYSGVASVVFTLPPLARVGMLEEEARAAGRRFRASRGDSSSWYSSRRVRERAGGFKILVEEDTERILGAHLLGYHAEEVINLFALAIRHKLTASQLKETTAAYPTASSDIKYML